MVADQDELPSKQGSASSGWIVLDYGSLIVHIMTPQLRNFYKLEKRWKDSEEYDFTQFLTELYGVDRGEYTKKNFLDEDNRVDDEDDVDKGWSGSEDNEVGLEEDIDPFWS